jgi:DNA replication protein
VKGFSGFPPGRLRTISLPGQFFGELLPIIDNLAELKVTLYCWWRLSQKQGCVRYMLRGEIAADEVFMGGLGARPDDQAEALRDGLERATARGTLLHVQLEGPDRPEDLYFFNTARGRAAVEGIRRGEWKPSGDPSSPFDLLIERPNIFVLYEQNIGPLTPLIADTLKDAEANYPPDWIEEAIGIAVENNVRKWAYIEAILERWQSEGRERGTGRDTRKDRRRYVEGEFSEFIEH